MIKKEVDNFLVTDKYRVLKGYIRLRVLQEKSEKVKQVVRLVSDTVNKETNLKDTLDQMLISDLWYVSMVGKEAKSENRPNQ